jgi:hypothetical protein
MKKYNEMHYLSGLINQDHYYGADLDKTAIKRMNRKINRILENIDSAMQDSQPPDEDSSKDASSATSFFTKLNKDIINNKLAGDSIEGIQSKSDAVKSKLSEFAAKFKADNPKLAMKLDAEAISDSASLKELALKAEGILGQIGKGLAMIGGGILLATWKALKFVLLGTLRLIIRIAKSIMTEKMPQKVMGYNVEGLGTLLTVCFALMFPFLGLFTYAAGSLAVAGGLLIPSGIYYMYMIMTQLLS